MIGGGLILNGIRGGRSQAVSDHKHLVMNLTVELYLRLRIVLRVLFKEFHRVAVDAAIGIDVIEEYLNAFGQGNPNRGCHRAGVG